MLLLAGIAAVVSYQHMHELARRHGESSMGAILAPLAVDGMIVASSMSILLASRYGRRGGVLPWALLIVSSLASLAANVAVAEPTLIARVIAAWPSIALIGAYEMLMGQIRQSCTPGLVISSAPGAAATDDQRPLESEAGGDHLNQGDEGRELQRLAWRWALANRRPDGTLPPGAVIAAQFSRSSRWGRWVKHLGESGRFHQEP
ncbi:DUF2637 domain-containing protein [Spongiactinospora gelatinilytica]|uniref:DUF2637 domain-containing protein n=1 Tax=Spongiactinospora gelatinilytica TaxID=2666298 RepID=UPI001F363837|nr:DUF2637 domain-containing protein [Spongiactinospora gelatinilytica]